MTWTIKPDQATPTMGISISNRTTPGAIGERTRNHRGAGFRRDDSGSSPTRIQAMLRVEKPNQG